MRTSIVKVNMPRKVAFPCSQCDKSTACKKESIECAACGSWVHSRCVPLSAQQLKDYGASDVFFWCRRCAVLDGHVRYMKMLIKLHHDPTATAAESIRKLLELYGGSDAIDSVERVYNEDQEAVKILKQFHPAVLNDMSPQVCTMYY